ncbi:MAG: tetratricopeptide repeat protein, partial [Pirellulales bacterium]
MKRSLFAVSVVAAFAAATVLITSLPSIAGNGSPEFTNAPAVPAEVRAFIQGRDYPSAVAAIDRAIAKGDGPADYLLYLKGRTLHYQRKYDNAVLAFDALIEAHPDSRWVRQAKFAKGAAHARKGDFRVAEKIYREQADFLLSTEHRQEIASIYLDFADAYLRPANELTKPDYDRARKFYEKALDVGPSPLRRAEVELRIGRCFEELEKWAEAAKRYAAFWEKYAQRTAAGDEGVGDVPVGEVRPLRIDAAYRLGWCQLKQGQRAKARRTWHDLLASELKKEADGQPSHERFAEAAFHLPETYGAPQPQSDEDLDLAMAAFDRFIKQHADHKLASTAHLLAIESLMHRGRFAAAAKRVVAYLADARYGDREETPRIQLVLGTCLLRQKKFTQAIDAWRGYLANYPAHEGWAGAQKAIIGAEFAIAADAAQQKDYARARKRWSEFLAKYPLDPHAARILTTFGQMNYDQEKWDDAIADWRRVVSKYPKSNEASQAQYQIAFTLETKLGQLSEALKEYKKLDWGSHQAQAQQRIAQLVRQEMSISTDRVFRTDESPMLTLKTRNVQAVTVKIYTVDLETYFRKMHLARGVERLDIALIDPDKTFEYEVPDYETLKRMEGKVKIPLPSGGPPEAAGNRSGVMAVTVSSKRFEATTLVLRSDLDIIVKSSRDEVLVFSQNMQTGKAWPGVRLLLSDGSKVFAEVSTGDDGVLKKSFKELTGARDVRVFAIADGSVASNVVGLKGLGVSQGLADKGYIITDRPAYRAGQMVHVRGVVRRVAGDKYVVDAGKAFDIQVLDPRGRQVWVGDVTLNTFGSFHCHFLLPDASPQGAYRIDVRETEKDGGKRSYQGTFGVHAYKLEPIHLVVDTPRRVYYRGELIEGTILAEFYHGAPLVGRTIRYKIVGQPWVTATTDDKGQVALKLPTREFREAQRLQLVVQLPERNVSTTAVFIIATRGFATATSTPRDTFLAGESFETTVTTIDAEGKPVGRELEATLYQTTRVDGQPGEKKIASKSIVTAEEDGKGRVTFTADEGGPFFVRFTGRDRFENPITATHTLTISDDKDRVRLRILAERHTFHVGDNATLRVHWREEPALALVTYQGAKILGYQLVELTPGENELAVSMTAELAPNFDLAISVMTGRVENGEGKAASGEQESGQVPKRFHEASSPFTVIREMKVAMEVSGDGEVVPGEEIEVAITTTDPQGRPVAAELSLAMIGQALLDRFAGNGSAIGDFFRGTRRQSAVRTTSSVTFDYRPKTRSIDASLLAERERLETAAEEEAAMIEIPALSFSRDGRLLDEAAGAPADADDDLFGDSPASRPAIAAVRRSRSGTRSGGGGLGGGAGEGRGDALGRQDDRIFNFTIGF